MKVEALKVLLQKGRFFAWFVFIGANIFELIENWLNILPNIVEPIFLAYCDRWICQFCDRKREGRDSNFCRWMKSESDSILCTYSEFLPVGLFIQSVTEEDTSRKTQVQPSATIPTQKNLSKHLRVPVPTSQAKIEFRCYTNLSSSPEETQ